ncbi:MAG: hypothetical protein SH850_21590, partial [Planctomycetaceae bacterium]|nr:hypothetical protein [Planctomycetaceae bacterium]
AGQPGAEMEFAPDVGVQTAAVADDAGESFRFVIQAPVTLAKQQSALLPIVNDRITAERIAIYNPASHPQHPLAGIRLTNSTDVHLQPGPITVFDAGEYAGDAQIADIAPKAERLLTYALNLDVEVAPQTEAAVKRPAGLAIQQGNLVVRQTESRMHRYVLKNAGDKTVKLLIERPIVKDWPTVKPAPAEQTRDTHRFAAQVAAGKTETVVITDERPLEESLSLKSLDSERLTALSQTGKPSDKVLAAINDVLSLKKELLTRTEQRRQVEQAASGTTAEQQRLRENVKTVTATDPVRERFVKKLAETEDRLEKLTVQLAEATRSTTDAERALDQRLKDLTVE